MQGDAIDGVAAPAPEVDRSGLDCVRLVALYFDKTVDAAWLWQSFATDQGAFDRQSVVRGLQHLGFQVLLKRSTRRGLERAAFPSLLEMADGRFALIGRVHAGVAYLQCPGEAGTKAVLLDELLPQIGPRWLVIARKQAAWSSERFGLGWFFQALLRYKGLLGETLMASLALQVFALMSPFAFQVVIDKVLVHKGLSTLDVIVVGLAVSALFEVVLTALRTYVLTHTTSRVDAELGAKIYRHLLGLPMWWARRAPARARWRSCCFGCICHRGAGCCWMAQTCRA